jgi:hypothetical protein
MASLTPEGLAILNESGESHAWADYFLCAPPDFVESHRPGVERIGSIWVTMIPELDWAFFNRIVGLGVGDVATESTLDAAIGVLQSAGCTNYMAQVCPLGQPEELPEWLAARGFIKSRSWAKVFRGNGPAPEISTDLRLESVGREHADAFAHVAATAFGMPPELQPLVAGNVDRPGWHHYLGFDGEQPVSAAAMFVRDDVGWFGFDSTLESHRNRGGQGAMMARRIQDGLALGCKWFVTETGEETEDEPNPSYHNMLRSGFELAYLRPNYVHQPAES